MEFDPLADDVQADPYPVYRWFREHEPVAYNEALDAVVSCSGSRTCCGPPRRRVLRVRPRVSLSPGPPTRAGRTLIATDNPVHGQLRSAISAFFPPRAVARFEPRVRALVTEHLDAFSERGACELMREFAIPVPIIVVVISSAWKRGPSAVPASGPTISSTRT